MASFATDRHRPSRQQRRRRHALFARQLQLGERHRVVAAADHLKGATGAGLFRAEVERLVSECERDLRRECERLLFTAARFERYGQQDRAQRAWREVLLHYPGDDPAGCRHRAEESVVSSQPDFGVE